MNLIHEKTILVDIDVPLVANQARARTALCPAKFLGTHRLPHLHPGIVDRIHKQIGNWVPKPIPPESMSSGIGTLDASLSSLFIGDTLTAVDELGTEVSAVGICGGICELVEATGGTSY